MRASGRDIVELFGYRPDDITQDAKEAFHNKICPFTSGKCTKTNHNQSVVYGTCSVSSGVAKTEESEIIICPKRLYANQYASFSHVLESAWPSQSKTLVSHGSLSELKARALKVENPVIAFGQGSGKELQVDSNGRLSMDWVLQSYSVNDGSHLDPQSFVGLEVQSIDTTGNYRDTWNAYRQMKNGIAVDSVPNSGHGLNWANVHKRLIPQIIRKGNIYAQIERCVGFYFMIPDSVYQKFEEVMGDVPTAGKPSRENLSVITFRLGENVNDGMHRELQMVRQIHYSLNDVAVAFTTNSSASAPKQLDQNLRSIFD